MVVVIIFFLSIDPGAALYDIYLNLIPYAGICNPCRRVCELGGGSESCV